MFDVLIDYETAPDDELLRAAQMGSLDALKEIVRRLSSPTTIDKARFSTYMQPSGDGDSFPDENYGDRDSVVVQDGVDTAGLSLAENKGGNLRKGRTYVSDPAQAPEGVDLKTGPRGGRYYEPQSQGNTKQDTTRAKTERRPKTDNTKKGPQWWADEATEEDFSRLLSFDGLVADVGLIEREDEDGDWTGVARVWLALLDGEEMVGTLERHFSIDGEVTHATFEVEPKYQNGGIASRMTEIMEEKYLEAGFSSVSLAADITVGKYAWAQMGYDFDPNGHTDVETAKKKLHAFLVEWGRSEQEATNFILTSSLKHSWDFATLDDSYEYEFRFKDNERPSGTARLGKAFMLDVNGLGAWEAKKTLDENDLGWKVGKAYYAAKKKKRNLTKARIYLEPGMQPPLGVQIRLGPRGGRYYESEGRMTPEFEAMMNGLTEKLTDIIGYTTSLTEDGLISVIDGLAAQSEGATFTPDGELVSIWNGDISAENFDDAFDRFGYVFSDSMQTVQDEIRRFNKDSYDDETALEGSGAYIPDWEREDIEAEMRQRGRLKVWEQHNSPEWWAWEARKEDYVALFSFGDYTAQITNLEQRDDHAYIELALYKDGVRAASLHRYLHANGQVSHALFTVVSHQQASGLGSAMNEIMEERYKSAGFTAIALSADIDVGKYAWAQMGYTWESGSPYGSEELKEFLFEHFGVEENDTFDRNEEIERLNQRYDDERSYFLNLKEKHEKLLEEATNARPYRERANEAAQAALNANPKTNSFEFEYMPEGAWAWRIYDPASGEGAYMDEGMRLFPIETQEPDSIRKILSEFNPEVADQVASAVQAVRDSLEKFDPDDYAVYSDYVATVTASLPTFSSLVEVRADPDSSNTFSVRGWFDESPFALSMDAEGRVLGIRCPSMQEVEERWPNRTKMGIDINAITRVVYDGIRDANVRNYEDDIGNMESRLESSETLLTNLAEGITELETQSEEDRPNAEVLKKIESILDDFPFEGEAYDWASYDDGNLYDWQTSAKSGKGHLGKAFMLSPHFGAWDGVKQLDDDDQGWNVGKMYYDKKSKKGASVA